MQSVSERLVDVLLTNTTIEYLSLEETDLLVPDNVDKWINVIMNDTTLMMLGVNRRETRNKLKEGVKIYLPRLCINI